MYLYLKLQLGVSRYDIYMYLSTGLKYLRAISTEIKLCRITRNEAQLHV